MAGPDPTLTSYVKERPSFLSFPSFSLEALRRRVCNVGILKQIQNQLLNYQSNQAPKLKLTCQLSLNNKYDYQLITVETEFALLSANLHKEFRI